LGSAMAERAMGLARSVRRHRGTRIRVADLLAVDLSQTGSAPPPLESRTRLHPQRSASSACQNQVDSALPVAANLGIRGREIADRSGMVVLSFLGSRLFAKPARHLFGGSWAAHCRDLFDLRRRQRR